MTGDIFGPHTTRGGNLLRFAGSNAAFGGTYGYFLSLFILGFKAII
jgi:hypothetical protein